MGDELLAVRPDFYGLRRRSCLHLPGVLLGRCEWVRNRILNPRGAPGGFSSGAYRWIRASYVERQNLTLRMDAEVQQQVLPQVRNLAHGVSMHFMHYDFARSHATLKEGFSRP